MLNTTYKSNWEDTKKRFTAWWDRSCIGRPILSIFGITSAITEKIPPPLNDTERYLDVDRIVREHRNSYLKHLPLAEAYPCMSVDLGPGSLALYLGSEPVFTQETVWFKECVSDGWKKFGPLKFNPDNPWWQKHLAMVRRAKELSGNDLIINMPDMIENIDILSAMRGPVAMLWDLIDDPEPVKERLNELVDLYFMYFDRLYELIKDEDNGNSFTAFRVWGPGKTAKVQCDFSAMMSPNQFREFVLPTLREQCRRLDFSIYHLDGPDAIRHVDALMEIEELDALQWTCGAGKPGGAEEIWYSPIYDKVKRAGKCLWISLDEPDPDKAVIKAERLVKRYGPAGLYLLFGSMPEDKARSIIERADRYWH